MEEKLILKGGVEHFKKHKGYGFIKDMNNSKKCFFHIIDAFLHINEGATFSNKPVKSSRGLNDVNIEQV